jgi:hypothetical protein
MSRCFIGLQTLSSCELRTAAQVLGTDPSLRLHGCDFTHVHKDSIAYIEWEELGNGHARVYSIDIWEPEHFTNKLIQGRYMLLVMTEISEKCVNHLFATDCVFSPQIALFFVRSPFFFARHLLF